MKRATLLFLLLLAACRDRQPEQPTAEQSNQLNETENMLDEAANRDSAQ